VILGIYAWSLLVPELRGAIMVIGTDAVATEAMPEKVVEAGWAGGPGLTDSRVFVSGSRATAEGRVMWSKAGGVLPYGDRMAGRFGGPHHPLAQLRDVIRQTYPGLADAPIAGTWAGPIERSKTGLPLFGALPICPDILYGYGYSGSGVVASLLGARILASLALEHGDEWTNLGLVRPPTRGFPPEPIRYIGGHMVRAAIERQDRLDHEGRRPGPITRALVAFKPSSYKPA
jgi:glycine/D-amino acid oxidase-like deaminating enzyme